jgi:hypothetical protein
LEEFDFAFQHSIPKNQVLHLWRHDWRHRSHALRFPFPQPRWSLASPASTSAQYGVCWGKPVLRRGWQLGHEHKPE